MFNVNLPRKGRKKLPRFWTMLVASGRSKADRAQMWRYSHRVFGLKYHYHAPSLREKPGDRVRDFFKLGE